MMKNAINWFEIPVKNFEKAKSFYEEVLQSEMQLMEMKEMGATMAFFPSDMGNGGIGGSIIPGPDYEPSQQGALIYLNGGEDLSDPLSRVEKAGGKIIVPKTSLGSSSNRDFTKFLNYAHRSAFEVANMLIILMY